MDWTIIFTNLNYLSLLLLFIFGLVMIALLMHAINYWLMNDSCPSTDTWTPQYLNNSGREYLQLLFFPLSIVLFISNWPLEMPTLCICEDKLFCLQSKLCFVRKCAISLCELTGPRRHSRHNIFLFFSPPDAKSGSYVHLRTLIKLSLDSLLTRAE